MQKLGLFSITLAVTAAIVLASVGPTLAQDDARKKEALRLYDEGTKKYNIGEWDEAVSFYKKAYDAFPAPEFLFNIAQSYRQKNDCKNGAFFYRRYLANKPEAENRDQVQVFVSELEAMCRNQKVVQDKPPSNPMPPDGDGKGATTKPPVKPAVTKTTAPPAAASTTGSTSTSASQPDASVTTSANVKSDSFLVLSAKGGAAKVSMGDLDIPIQAALSISAGYPLAVGPLEIVAGGLFSFTAVPWENGAESGRASMISLLANGTASYPVTRSVSVGGELGLGLLTMTGITDAAAPIFLAPGKRADGALTMFNFRVSLAVEWQFLSNLALTVNPLVFSYSPAKEGFSEDITTVNNMAFLAGISYRL